MQKYDFRVVTTIMSKILSRYSEKATKRLVCKRGRFV